jgi:hypothetical protein
MTSDDKPIDLRSYKVDKEKERDERELERKFAEFASTFPTVERAYRQAIKEQNRVRSPLIEEWAGRCLAHAECCKLEPSQIKYLRLVSGFRFRNWGRDLDRSLAWLEPMKVKDLFDKYEIWTSDYNLFKYGKSDDIGDCLAFDKKPMEQPSKIWAKIRCLHKIENTSPGGTIERELEDFVIEEAKGEFTDQKRLELAKGGKR